MRLVERDHQNVPMEELMIQAFSKHGTERAAAQSLGITQQSFNAWKYRLELDDDIERIRQQRDALDDLSDNGDETSL
jgi:hypothetical protein